jgi:hypothetical protein
VFELGSPQTDARPNLRDDGREIFFYSNRPDSIGGSLDLWTSTRETCLDAWSTPVNLGGTVNSASSEQHPTLSCDGETLIFSSNRPGGFGLSDLYMTTRTKLEGLTTDVDGKEHREDHCKPSDRGDGSRTRLLDRARRLARVSFSRGPLQSRRCQRACDPSRVRDSRRLSLPQMPPLFGSATLDGRPRADGPAQVGRHPELLD